jgi:hypothetical protein
MTPLTLLAIAVITVALLMHMVVIALAVRAAMRGRRTLRLRNAIFACFGALVAGVGLLAVSVTLASESMIALVVGTTVMLMGLSLIAVAGASEYRATD